MGIAFFCLTLPFGTTMGSFNKTTNSGGRNFKQKNDHQDLGTNNDSEQR